MDIYLVVWQMPRMGDTFHYGAFLHERDARDFCDKLDRSGASEAYVANSMYGTSVTYRLDRDNTDIKDVWVVYDQTDKAEFYIFSEEQDAWDKRDECVSWYSDLTKAPFFTS